MTYLQENEVLLRHPVYQKKIFININCTTIISLIVRNVLDMEYDFNFVDLLQK
jgi:hypothetical protein